jgi:3-oxoadipate enol-lactonase
VKIKANGIDINYIVEGAGPWLAMSHSLACDISMWDEQAALLAKRFKVLRFDTRGHGKSEAPSGAYTLEQLADDAKALFDAVGAHDVHWVGLSMGGMIGQTLALKPPGLLKSLVLSDTTSHYPAEAAPLWAGRIKTAEAQGMEPLVQATLERWFTAPYRKAQPERVARIAESIRNTSVPGYVGCCHAIPKINVTARLKEIKCPALVIVGEQDPGTPPAMAREIQENLPGAQLVVIPSAAHIANIEQPEAFNRALTKFYDQIVG